MTQLSKKIQQQWLAHASVPSWVRYPLPTAIPDLESEVDGLCCSGFGARMQPAYSIALALQLWSCQKVLSCAWYASQVQHRSRLSGWPTYE